MTPFKPSTTSGVGMNSVPGGRFPVPTAVSSLMSRLPPPECFHVSLFYFTPLNRDGLFSFWGDLKNLYREFLVWHHNSIHMQWNLEYLDMFIIVVHCTSFTSYESYHKFAFLLLVLGTLCTDQWADETARVQPYPGQRLHGRGKWRRRKDRKTEERGGRRGEWRRDSEWLEPSN